MKLVDLPEPEPLSFWHDLIREYQPEKSKAEMNTILAGTSWPLAEKEKITREIESFMHEKGFKRQTNGK